MADRTSPDQLSSQYPGIDNCQPEAVQALWEDFLIHPELKDNVGYLPFEQRELPRWAKIISDTALHQTYVFPPTEHDPARVAEDISNIFAFIVNENNDTSLAPPETTLSRIIKFAREFAFTAPAQLAPSPCFPGGRDVRLPLVKADGQLVPNLIDRHSVGIETPNGVPFPEEIRDELVWVTDMEAFQNRERYRSLYAHEQSAHEEAAANQLELISPRNEERFAGLWREYGAKSANLICFSEAITPYNLWAESTKEAVAIRIPPFLPVSVDLYHGRSAPDFEDRVEALRQETLALVANDPLALPANALVIIRSSAVHSEDGNHHNAAGLYDSIPVDPQDASAFLAGIRRVYDSVESESAVAYRAGIGVEQPEEMGLVVQSYRETILPPVNDDYSMFFDRPIGSPYGQAQHDDTENPVRVITNYGELLYDFNDLRAYFGWPPSAHADYEATSFIGKAQAAITAPPLMVIAAERYFGGPALVEFIGNELVQVRRNLSQRGEVIEFPDLPVLYRGAAVGLGDLEVMFLPRDINNHTRPGYIVIYNEHDTTGSESHDRRIYPESGNGVVFLKFPSAQGHVRNICQEKGLICIYPDGRIPESEDLKVFEPPLDSKGQLRRLRVVSNGYEARIYLTDQ